MRTAYERREFEFDNWQESISQQPDRVVVHRQGNPGAKAINSLNWGNDTQAYTIHSYAAGKVCYDAIPPSRHAFHVKEYRKVQTRGGKWSGLYGPRGDYNSVGVECEDVKGGGPGQTYSLTQDTRITLLLRVRDYLRQFNLTPEAVEMHSDLDPWTRSADLGNALNLGDFRADLDDLLAGREPWRTVGQYATAVPAPLSWKPSANAVPPRPPSGTDRPWLVPGFWRQAVKTARAVRYEGAEAVYEFRIRQ